jgi:hypothetical protein
MRLGPVQLAACFAVLLSSLPLIPANAADESFADWARVLYQGAVAMREAAEQGAGTDLADADIQALFTPEVQKLRTETADRVMPPTEPEGPILHILFGWGALPHRKIEIVSVRPDGADGAIVNLTINGNARPLRLTGVFSAAGKAWQIDDIDYGSGGPDRALRGRLARMQGWARR